MGRVTTRIALHLTCRDGGLVFLGRRDVVLAHPGRLGHGRIALARVNDRGGSPVT